MKTLSKHIKQLIIHNRTDWLALMTQGYGVAYPSLWKALGYQSQNEFEADYHASLLSLPNAKINE